MPKIKSFLAALKTKPTSKNLPLVKQTEIITVTETVQYDSNGNIKSKKTTSKVRNVTTKHYKTVEDMHAATTLEEIGLRQDEINLTPTSKNLNTCDINYN